MFLCFISLTTLYIIFLLSSKDMEFYKNKTTERVFFRKKTAPLDPLCASFRPLHVSSVRVSDRSVADMPLVTQPMLQCRPNRTELRSMDSYIQILCRFQKCRRKVSPTTPLFFFKSTLGEPKENFSHPLGE